MAGEQDILISQQIQLRYFVPLKSKQRLFSLQKLLTAFMTATRKANPNAKKYDEVHIQEVIDKKLAVVDMTASIMCMENKMTNVGIRFK